MNLLTDALVLCDPQGHWMLSRGPNVGDSDTDGYQERDGERERERISALSTT